MRVKKVKVSDIAADPANLRLHGSRNTEAIKASLMRFGQQKPIVVDADGIVRAGNGTLAAAIALGWQEIAVTETSLKGSDATAYAIADNRTAELAEWDDTALVAALEALNSEDQDLLAAAGFEDSELSEMIIKAMADAPDTDEAEGGEEEKETQDWINFTVPLSAGQEQVVRRVLKLGKAELGVTSSGEVLKGILESWESNLVSGNRE